MSLLSRLVGTVARLPRVTTPQVTVSRDVPVPMPDGVILLADHYSPQDARGNHPRSPTILVRCPYDRRGRSVNVCDALQRIRPDAPEASADGSRHLTFALWPTAHRFRRGHRPRLQVSSGAYPRYARNTGSGEPLATATTLVVAEQSIYHDPEHPSSVRLSIPIASLP